MVGNSRISEIHEEPLRHCGPPENQDRHPGVLVAHVQHTAWHSLVSVPVRVAKVFVVEPKLRQEPKAAIEIGRAHV